ncbi:DUF4303 domain-containing protein [Leifsonia sp. NPDC058194]|uniref:DUF4303 domain-containing protein n=1 Tax=Leifsonia sp. NPDC058194 TaxID=3346374 RepID=UPI0036D7C1DD
MTLEHHPAAYDRVRAAIRDAARTAWTNLRREHPESFYYFGLWTTPLAHRPAPTAISTEGQARALDDYRARDLAVSADDLRWAENDSPYDLFGDDGFAEVELLFDAFGNPYDRPREVNEALFETITGALADLDAEGFFGAGAERDTVVLNVTMPGHDEKDDLLESARALNPPSALVRYEADRAE